MFLIKCSYCPWMERTTGFSKDISHLMEVKSSCDKCGKPRIFICPNCKRKAIMKRIP